MKKWVKDKIMIFVNFESILFMEIEFSDFICFVC